MEGLVLVIILAVAFIGAVMAMISRYRRCPSNKILVIYGKTSSGAAKCIHGGAAFVWPLIQDFAYLDLEPFVVPIDLKNALSLENIRVTVPTTVTAAISNTKGIMQNAAVRLLGLTRQQIEDQAQDIILGQMRAVIATMRIEEINQDRQAFLAKVNDSVSGELEKIGLYLINVNIRDIGDESGYIEALGRRAAAEAINQALIDVAEQEKLGQTGVAERERDKRVAVAAATAEAEIGEATADRDRRSKRAGLDAEAALGETEARSKKAAYVANQGVAEQEARQRSESAAREADGAIRVAQENAEKKAEEARAEREAARLNASVVVPAEATKKQTIIEAEAQKERSIRIAQGEAEAKLAKMKAEAAGVQAILDGKAKGYEALVNACETANQAASLLLIEKLQEVASVQAQAIQDLPIEKVIVWDGGGKESGLNGLGGRLMGALPPMHELAKQVGLELPDFLGKMEEAQDSPAEK
ncbi:MAG: flotillin family protein [Lentisphaerae bacterium]|nr:flotillin family protein [Lentisphaerota bacterium]